MSASILVTYATRYGSTQEVAEAVAATLREGGTELDIQPMRKVRTLERYGVVVLGAPLYIGRWHKDALRFLSRQREALTQMPASDHRDWAAIRAWANNRPTKLGLQMHPSPAH